MCTGVCAQLCHSPPRARRLTGVAETLQFPRNRLQRSRSRMVGGRKKAGRLESSKVRRERKWENWEKHMGWLFRAGMRITDSSSPPPVEGEAHDAALGSGSHQTLDVPSPSADLLHVGAVAASTGPSCSPGPPACV